MIRPVCSTVLSVNRTLSPYVPLKIRGLKPDWLELLYSPYIRLLSKTILLDSIDSASLSKNRLYIPALNCVARLLLNVRFLMTDHGALPPWLRTVTVNPARPSKIFPSIRHVSHNLISKNPFPSVPT